MGGPSRGASRRAAGGPGGPSETRTLGRRTSSPCLSHSAGRPRGSIGWAKLAAAAAGRSAASRAESLLPPRPRHRHAHARAPPTRPAIRVAHPSRRRHASPSRSRCARPRRAGPSRFRGGIRVTHPSRQGSTIRVPRRLSGRLGWPGFKSASGPWGGVAGSESRAAPPGLVTRPAHVPRDTRPSARSPRHSRLVHAPAHASPSPPSQAA